MKNIDKWFAYTAGLPSPDSYIKWSFYSMIGSALQRRIYVPPEHDPIFPNMYITLVGKPGLGKGGPIRAAKKMLTEHKLEDANKSNDFKGDEKHIVKATEEVDIKEAQEEMMKGRDKGSSVEKALLIPVAAECVTYEALVQSMASCIRRINYVKTLPDGTSKMSIYSHATQSFILEEMSSLFKRKQEDLINFLLQGYDCSDVYEHRTKTSGRDRILRMCLNMLAGTTPDFIQRTFDASLIDQGFSSRNFFIYAAKNRGTVFFRPELTPEEFTYGREISAHVKKLTTLYGAVKIPQHIQLYLLDWLKEFEKSGIATSQKMEAFKARMNIHVMKVAMAIHFGESTEMEIQKESFDEAIDCILKELPTMQLALTIGGDNPLSRVATKIVEYLNLAGKRTEKQLLAQFWENIQTGKVGLGEILNYLQATDQIVAKSEKDDKTDIQTIYYMTKVSS